MGSPLGIDDLEELGPNIGSGFKEIKPIFKNMMSFYIIPFINWVINMFGLLFLIPLVVCEHAHIVGLKFWVKLMDLLGRRRIILDLFNDEPILERYYIFMKDRSDTFKFNIFIHKFLKSDPDDLHNHPWGYFTLIICGGYWEYMYEDGPSYACTPDGVPIPAGDTERKIIKKWRAPGFYQSVPANHTHRIELDPTKPNCWTLFIPRLRVQQWGFYKDDMWIESDKYLEERKKSI